VIKNEQGQIAIVNVQPIPYTIKVGEVTYQFIIKNGIALAWVNEEHTGKIFEVTRICCNGNIRHIFRYATQSQVNVWSGTGR
jgi:hypothetical protein